MKNKSAAQQNSKNINLVTVICLIGGLMVSLFGISIFLGNTLSAIGLFLMWKRTAWPKWIKIFATMPFILGLIIAFFTIIYMFVRPFAVVGNAMSPNYQDGQYLMTKILQEDDEIIRGDVVIVEQPDKPGISLIKRVIGLPNEKVSLENGSVKINGEILDEGEYLAENISTSGGKFLEDGVEKTSPEGHYFVLGDNREISLDSRAFGFISKDQIIGKVLYCYWNCER